MNKEQFLDELEKLLQDIDSIERDEALNYYRDYFEDAGSEHEQEVIDELGTPEKVAQEQKSLLNVNDFFKKIIIVGDNIKKSRYENGIIIMSIYDFLLDSSSLEY